MKVDDTAKYVKLDAVSHYRLDPELTCSWRVCDLVAAQVPSVQVTEYSRLRCSGANQLCTKR
jgi:hypothetical protein